MTEEQIFQIAREHLYVLTSVNEWCGEDEDILKFARALYDEGYTKGFKVGHDAGWELNEEVSRRGL
jgi:hypothetical protein